MSRRKRLMLKANEWMNESSETVIAATKDIDVLLKELDSEPEKGLTDEEAESRLQKYGKNELGEVEEETFWDELKEEAQEPMILLLLGVGVLYSIWGGLLDAATIFTIIAILVLSEVYNEWKAEKGIDSLKELTTPMPLVLRNGKIAEIPSEDLVPGDVLPLEVGERIPADARVYKSYGLQLDESSLTGESLPVPKFDDLVLSSDSQVTDLSNMVLSGTLIVQGEGVAVVVTTGRSTELGKIATLTEEAEEEDTPLQEAMEELSRTLVWIALLFSVSIPVLGYLRGQPLETMILTGLSLRFTGLEQLQVQDY